MSDPSFTPEQMSRAQERYRAECDALYADGYTGDFGMGLSWVMQTYSEACWLKYFQDEP